MRPTRTNLIVFTVLFIITALSVGYLLYSPESAKAESAALRVKLDALRGDPEAQMNYGILCMASESKSEEGIGWIKKASDQGYPQAQCMIGECYFNGTFLEKNIPKAIELYRQSAISGYHSAQSRLADCYVYGWGVNKSTTEALKWYHLAALNGDNIAMNNIGSIYLHGDGVKADFNEAFKWFHKAALSGNSGSQLTLGQMLLLGDGCDKDEVEAYAWFKIAAIQEDSATKELLELRKKITAEQIADSMNRIKILKARILEVSQLTASPAVSKN